MDLEVTSTNEQRLTIDIDFNGGIAIAQMLGRTNYMALVGGGKQPKFPQHKVGRPVRLYETSYIIG